MLFSTVLNKPNKIFYVLQLCVKNTSDDAQSKNYSAIFEGVDQSIGFYAVAYDVGGEAIISYRGTDDLLGDFFFDSDTWNGYGTGFGSSTANQAGMAFDFYNEVSNGGDPRDANISTTGHSLGGGLAGLVGAANDNGCALLEIAV